MADETIIRIEQSSVESYVTLFTPYRKGFIEAFKGRIDNIYRLPIYDEAGHFRFWMVHKVCLKQLVGVIREWYPTTDVSIPPDLVAETDLFEEVDWVQQIFKVCPSRHRAKLYRGLASAFHPDVGGDNDLMRHINKVYEYYEKLDKANTN